MRAERSLDAPRPVFKRARRIFRRFDIFIGPSEPSPEPTSGVKAQQRRQIPRAFDFLASWIVVLTDRQTCSVSFTTVLTSYRRKSVEHDRKDPSTGPASL
jgi:hypothetical protein